MADIWEYAKEFEKEGKDYYSKLASESGIDELAGVFSVLASEEQKHWDLLDGMQNALPIEGAGESETLSAAGEAFKKLAAESNIPDVIEDSESVYRQALELEKKSIEFYEDAVTKVDNPDHKDVLQFVAEQEKIHARIITGIIEFVRRPKEWLENAEWTHFEAY